MGLSSGESRLTCQHRFKYYGVVGVVVPGHTIGSIDLWQCTNCGAVDALARRIGDVKPKYEVGFKILEPDEKWVVLACSVKKWPDNWELLHVKPGVKIEHECADGNVEFEVDDKYGLVSLTQENIGGHKLVPIEDYIEKDILIVPMMFNR
ncbi:MAG: hypothetical protein QXP58_05830 [Thermoprotei archaeon]